MSLASISGWSLTVDATPLEEILSVSGLGKSNDILDVTNFDSPAGTKEYIAGLADGAEMTVECNFIAAAAGQVALQAAVDAGASVDVVMTYTTTTQVYTFTAAAQGWTISPSISDQNRIEFTLKVSGEIVIT